MISTVRNRNAFARNEISFQVASTIVDQYVEDIWISVCCQNGKDSLDHLLQTYVIVFLGTNRKS